MLLEFSNDSDPVQMVQKHSVDSEEESQDEPRKPQSTSFPRGGSLSEFSSDTSSCDEMEPAANRRTAPGHVTALHQSESELSQAYGHPTSSITKGESDDGGQSRLCDSEGLIEIREVWANNLEDEFRNICHLVQKYPFVAMDTEFPGTVANPVGSFSSAEELKYQLMKCNVDQLKLIQLGITLFDGSGTLPKGVCTWQFNFKFNLMEDMYAEESINLLKRSGLDFDQHSSHGIDTADFGEMFISSGLVLMENVTWIAFHSAYDFGYLLTTLTSQKLPESETEFLEILKIYFPNLYDIKYLLQSLDNHLMGGLQTVANTLKVERVGAQHQAGSDSLVTGRVFFTVYDKYFSEGLDDVKYSGKIVGFDCRLSSASGYSSSSMTGYQEPVCMSSSIVDWTYHDQ